MKNVIITGASQGFGLCIARKCLSEGANIAICSRNSEQLDTVTQELTANCKSKVFRKTCDVSNEHHVNAFIDESIRELGSIDAIILNAGIYGPMGPTESVPLDDWKKAIDINLFGVLLPCRRIIPYFKERKAGNIVVVSGGGATSPMPNISAYATSKAAVVRLVETLAHELISFNIGINAVAPGALNTRLIDQVLDAGPEIVGEEFYKKNLKWKKDGASSPDLGVELIWFLLNLQKNDITGRLISAQWDNWRTLPERIDELKPSDIYCLRRIVPEDRNKK
jgi:3-oxoacyl-[acyl-carrier protein] reductase